MTPEQLAELKTLANNATPGPWEWEETSPRMNGAQWNLRATGTPGIRMVVNEYQHGPENAQFIAAARTAVPELVAEVERLQKAVGLHRKIRRWANDDYSITDTTYQLALKHDPEEVADMTPFEVCEECYEVEDTIRQENDRDTLIGIRSYWPCPTIQALGETSE